MRNEKKRIIACALILLLVPLLLLCFAFCLPAQYDETYTAALNDKLALLKETEGPRVIVVGGSGAAFDVRADLLEEELPGYSVINDGLYAGLGTAVMLDLAAPYIRSGDVVVFLPEQSAQTLSGYFNAELLWQALDGESIPWASLSGARRRAMIGAFPAFAGSKARLCFFAEKPAGDGVYARRYFDSHGDVVCAGRTQNTMPNGYDVNMPISFDLSLIDEELVAQLNAFSGMCADRGASLYFCFCPMNAAAIAEGEGSRADAFAQALAQRLDFPILGTPGDAILEAGWFFDTNFHLNEAGQLAYTARFAALLKDAFGDKTPVTISVPDLPALPAAALTNADETDAECYRFEARGDGLWIVGLTEEGLGREALTVPGASGGRPVLGFDASVFAGDAALKTLTIGTNIASIPDAAFDGCASLERILLQNPHPASVSVGAGLLEGTDALLFVPQEAYSAYCTSYFWSVHASRLRPDTGMIR